VGVAWRRRLVASNTSDVGGLECCCLGEVSMGQKVTRAKNPMVIQVGPFRKEGKSYSQCKVKGER